MKYDFFIVLLMEVRSLPKRMVRACELGYTRTCGDTLLRSDGSGSFNVLAIKP